MGKYLFTPKTFLEIGTFVVVLSLTQYSFSQPKIDTSQVLGDRTSQDLATLINQPALETLIVTPAIKPTLHNSTEPPTIAAESAIALDRSSYAPLFEKNPQEKLAPASTTKIATAIVAINELPLNKVLTVPDDLYEYVSGSTMGLQPGEKISVENLLWGMLINSGNDAAFTLARELPSGEAAFIDAMNALASKLHLTSTSFNNSIGYDAANQFSSAYDLAILADYALNNPLIQQIVATKTTSVSSADDPATWHNLSNTNQLLNQIPGVEGIKTGWTELAEGVLVTFVTRNNHEVILVIMHSPQREEDMITLINWVFDNYQW